ncbi:MAG: response regulator transcription factor [Bacteroidales bacterium]|nr:response regulator transcription factor [Bacteroidales bacterium]
MEIPFRIVIDDNQFLIVETLKTLLSEKYQVKKIVGSKDELLLLLDSEKTDLIIVDPANLDFDGISDLQIIRNKYPGIPIVILTNNITTKEISILNRLRIKNILCKNVGVEELFHCINEAVNGRNYYSEIVFDQLMSDNDKRGQDSVSLTSSEIEIVRMIARGMTTKEIAEKKFISFHTVMTHRRNILRKLGVSNASELTMYAVSAGYIDTIEYHI